MCVFVSVHRCPQKSGDGDGSFGAEVIDVCKLLSVDTGTQEIEQQAP